MWLWLHCGYGTLSLAFPGLREQIKFSLSAKSGLFKFKTTFSFHKIIPKNAQMTTLYTNYSLYITFTMIYYIRQESFCKSFSSLSYIRRISGLFIANAMLTHWHVLSKMKTNTSLTTLCSHFLLSYSNQAMTKTAHWWSWSCDLHG